MAMPTPIIRFAYVCGANEIAQNTFCTSYSYDDNCTNPAVAWKDGAKTGVDGLTDLRVLSADGVSTDNPATNYILGQVNELNLGFDQDQGDALDNIKWVCRGQIKPIRIG